MIREREIYLFELALEDQLNDDEYREFHNLLNQNNELRKEFEEQKKVKEVLNKMSLKNPTKEFWDGYWLGIYNRIERGLAWILISVSAVLFVSYAAYQAVTKFFSENNMPEFIKVAIVVFVVGSVILVISLIRERIFSYKRDKYKEIQR